VSKKNNIPKLLFVGIGHHQEGRLQKAQSIYQQILSLDPRHFDALHLQGVVAAQMQNLSLALDLIGKAIKINPNSAEAYFNNGNILKEFSRLEEAVENYKKAVDIKHDLVNAHFNLGITLHVLGRFNEAVICYENATTYKHNFHEAYNNCGNALIEIDRTDKALESFNKAISLNPKYAEAYNNRGNAYKKLGRMQEAIADYETAISIDIQYAEAYNNRGNVLFEQKDYRKAAKNFEEAITIKSDYADAWYNLGNSYKELADLEEAVDCYDRAITLKSNYATAYWNKSLALLLAGQFEMGFQLFEWRWKLDSKTFTATQRNYEKPLWLGKEDLSGRTLLIHAEQGLGDCIQFSRYSKLVTDLGANVILLVPKPIVGLLQSLVGVDLVLEDESKELPTFDYHCPLMSLPLAFKTEINTVPVSTSYLSISKESLRSWNNFLGEKKKPRLGIVWSSVSDFKNDSDRSMKLEQFIKCIPQNKFEIYCLQKVIKPEDQETFNKSSEVNFHGHKLNDFLDTAGLASCMDLVVSTCTSVPHMTAALGIPTWILLNYVPDWRWLVKREDSPWYKSVKLYRQGETREWDEVLTNVRDDLIRGF